ncbi:MAG TPA: patatin-like phospholipase family protein [Bacteroidota bacterium]|nr:patatin-like phospholipase family protein [Bacteroidota bacterium]
MILSGAAGCAHYPVNQPITHVDPDSGYRGKFMGVPGNSDELLLYLTFSGGGTRAAAFSYGVLEELRATEVTIGGEKRRLLDEIDAISAVSGGSFTAGYYGLFGERIFEDFEPKFLKKNIQGNIAARIFLNPYNWVRFLSPYFDRSDLAAEYYDNNVFEHGTFGDIAARKGPMIHINATDMVDGVRLSFNQDSFDVICSDVSSFPVARAAAASSAVPILLTPIALRNHAGTCGFALPPKLQTVLREQEISSRQYHLVNDLRPFLNAEKKKYIHLVDGGVSDNLGLRTALDRVTLFGNLWSTLQYTGLENTHKIAFIVVNAETEVSKSLNLFGKPPALSAMLDSYSSIAITRYNYETVMLLRENFSRWAEEVRRGRCGNKPVSTKPGACGDIKFYLIEVKFDALKDEEERNYYKQLPTSFSLSGEQVDKLRQVARRILTQSEEYHRFLSDLR